MTTNQTDDWGWPQDEPPAPTDDWGGVSLCRGCYCMTHTVDGVCGKCGAAKVDDGIDDLLHEFGKQYDMPYDYLPDKVNTPPAHQLPEARAALVAPFARRIRALLLKERMDQLAYDTAIVAYADGFTGEQPFIHNEYEKMKRKMEELNAARARLEGGQNE